MPTEYIVLTSVGADRPGLVDTVSEYVYSRGGNVEASRAATLGGEFAMIMLVSGESAAVTAIGDETDQLARDAALNVTVKSTTAPSDHPAPPDTLPYILTVYSMDHPGIVQAVTHELACRDVNVRSLDTHVESAPHTGTAVFNLHALLDIPAAENIAAFRVTLQAMAERLNVDVQLTAADD